MEKNPKKKKKPRPDIEKITHEGKTIIRKYDRSSVRKRDLEL